jgi:cytohesin
MESELHEAVRLGDGERVKELLAGDGVRVNEVDWLDQTPLHCAAMGGRDGLVRLLLSAGADPGALDESGCTPLHRRVGDASHGFGVPLSAVDVNAANVHSTQT